MTAELQEYKEHVHNIQRGIQPTHMYYRQPNGWITVGAATFIERARFMGEGWQPLDAYGRFDMANVWSANNPHVTLFQFGGAKEMPLDQIIAHGYYHKAPLVPTCGMALTERHKHDGFCYQDARPARFPQLEDVAIEGPFACHFCNRNDLATPEALHQHEMVAHKKEKESILTGSVLADHLIKGLQPSGTIRITDAPSAPRAEETLNVLAEVGLTKKQIQALQAAGLIPAGDGGEVEADD